MTADQVRPSLHPAHHGSQALSNVGLRLESLAGIAPRVTAFGTVAACHAAAIAAIVGGSPAPVSDHEAPLMRVNLLTISAPTTELALPAERPERRVFQARPRLQRDAATPSPITEVPAPRPLPQAPILAAPPHPQPDTRNESPPDAPPLQVAKAEAQVSATSSADHQAVIFDAAYLDNPKPAYPLAARRRGEAGTVLLRVRVDADGAVKNLELAASSGYERLDRAALNGVARWQFVPARQGGQAIASWVQVPVVFSLTE